MKKALIILTLIALMASGALAQDTTPQTPDEICFAHNGHIDDAGKCRSEIGVTIKVDYPLELAGNSFTANLIDAWISAQRQQFVSDWVAGGDSPSLAPWEMDITYQLYQHSDSIQSVLLTGYFYTGGAHGGTVLQTYTYDLAAETVFELQDLFKPGVDVLTTLQGYARASIAKQLGDGADEDWIEQGTADLGAFQHFVIDGDHLVITFDQYQVGPYAVGNLQVSIPLDPLSDVLVPWLSV